ncbi:hypothetical protein O6H91_11G114400 [Diphasiastrum complanatum]|uniref:Uncharacterized protein n=1 Tax=Diphasiastrum complanatum TaxID=34168 RepID=A0ACC2CDB4_DIPCM|nr:hypothetical protein O6H91_11G114400 [Diphasiastrum complanatum]
MHELISLSLFHLSPAESDCPLSLSLYSALLYEKQLKRSLPCGFAAIDPTHSTTLSLQFNSHSAFHLLSLLLILSAIQMQTSSKSKSMEWLRSRIATSFQKAWEVCLLRVRSRRSRKRGRSFGELYDDVQACGYGDVQVMWSMLNHQSAVVNSKK